MLVTSVVAMPNKIPNMAPVHPFLRAPVRLSPLVLVGESVAVANRTSPSGSSAKKGQYQSFRLPGSYSPNNEQQAQERCC